MSLDIWLEDENEEEIVGKNITHNLGKMWIAAGVYEALYESKGKRAKDILPRLQEGLEKMRKDPDHYRTFNASNGWGTYENAVRWLDELIREFEDYPESIIGLSR